MIKVLSEDYDWILQIPNLKENYMKEYIISYINKYVGIEIDFDGQNNIEVYKIDSAETFGSIKDSLDEEYKITLADDKDTYAEYKYQSIKCKYAHAIKITADFADNNYTLELIVNLNPDTITDQEIIDMYEDNDEVLFKILDIEKGMKIS